jgi:hypothetical protein
MTEKKQPHFFKSPAAVADRILYLGLELPESRAEGPVEKNRVIAESAIPLFFKGDIPSNLAPALLEYAPIPGKDKLTDEPGSAFGPRDSFQEPQHFLDVFFVRGVGVGIAGREDSRGAVEMIDFEAGVLSQGQMFAQRAVGEAFLPGILQEGRPLFLDIAVPSDIPKG